jgi:hypothetical protein
MARFEDIVPFTRSASYSVDHGWDYLPIHYATEVLEAGLDVNPDFQRNYVWTPEQKVRYVEYVLRGGTSGRDLYFNCPGWRHGRVGPRYGAEGYYVLVDGKQRLDAVLGFLNNEFPIFGGNYRRDYTDRPHIITASFKWHVNDLKTREEVLQWYIDLNAGGTVHTPDEINRVRALKEANAPFELPTQEAIFSQAQMDREVIQKALRKVEAQKVELDARRAAEEATKPKRRSRKG